MLLILFIICIHNAQSLKVSQDPYYLKPGLTQTIHSEIQYFQEMCFFQRDLIPNQRYDIKVSFNGSEGINVLILWNTTNATLEAMLSTFQPMDTQKLRFKTDENGIIENRNQQEYRFYLVGYKNSRAINELSEQEGFQYKIKIEEVLIDDLPLYAVIQYLGGLFLSILVTKLLIYVIQNSAELNSYFQIKQRLE